ncbi:NHL repeat-containing protein [Paraburkholderia agricolaris]|jgi:serine/threonine-protein kinase|uniref:NHL repeat-containing protein n=1 Tax=Paraburkholderia agricolaris TaxID=2152888 RepID=UPI001C2BFB95|nr:NHL repeat-containing protein [Paraburkholderia agricolaris]
MNPSYSRIEAATVLVMSTLVLSACGGGGSGSGGNQTPPTVTPPGSSPGTPGSSYTIGGSVSGLDSGRSLSVLDNGADTLSITANGAFTFATPVSFNKAYAVTVGSQPSWQNCSVGNDSGVATSNVTNVTISCVAGQARVSTFAGSTTSGAANGAGNDASFNAPAGVALDSSGNVYVADFGNNEIRKITPAGLVSTFAGSGALGSANGMGNTASFNHPGGVAVDANDNVYVADLGNNEIRKITAAGVVSTLAGSTTPGHADGMGSSASFNSPWGVAVDASGNIYVADVENEEIRKITPAGLVSTFAGSLSAGSLDGTGSTALFAGPRGIAIDRSGNLYVADSSNNEIRKITPAGVVSTLAGSTRSGSADGTGGAASFSDPNGVAVDASGAIFVADRVNNEIRKITPTGTVSTIAGSSSVASSVNGVGSAASFAGPAGLVVDANDNIYVAEMNDNEIRFLTPAP